jgi:hypothetical protein
MQRKPYMVFMASMAIVAAALTTTACGDDPAPTNPTPTPATGTATLKVSAPTIVSPAGGGTVNTRNPTLVLQPVTGTYVQSSVSYELQVLTTGGDVVYSRTISGGPSNGQGTLSHTVDTPLNVRTSYRWRARAVSGSVAGPWSDNSASGATMFVTNTLTPGSSNAEFRDYFFSLTVQKNLTFPSQEAFVAMDADLVGVGIIIAKDSSGFIRGRIYLPTGGADKYARSVDVISGFGPTHRWVWNERGRTVCEGICP